MPSFEETQWADADSCREYLEAADHYVVERRTLLSVVASLYRKFLGVGSQRVLLDLGCGDGIIAETVYSNDDTLRAIEVDGSPEMLDAARKRLDGVHNAEFRRQTLQEFTATPCVEPASIDLVASAFAVHHLRSDEKRALFGVIPAVLKPDGFFLNVDIVLPDCSLYEDWFYELWGEWINARRKRLPSEEDYRGVPSQARENPENQYESLGSQLRMLREAGFMDVECFYRYGPFGVYGGRTS